MYGSTADRPGGSNGSDYTIGFAGETPGPSNSFDIAQFTRLCDTITSNIYAIDKHASTLEKTVKTIGSPNDSKTVRESVHILQTTANKTTVETAEQLKQLKLLLQEQRRGLANNGKEENRRVTKLTNDFETAIQRYDQLQKQIVAKMKTTLLRVPSQAPSFSETEDPGASLVEQEAQRQAQLQFQQEQLEFEQGLLIEREDKIRQIESDILDVNSIMNQLGAMVTEQGEVIDTIEGHVETAYSEVDTGREELQKAAAYQTKYRKRLFCIMGTALIVLIIIIIIIVIELK